MIDPGVGIDALLGRGLDAWWGWPPPVLDPKGPFADPVTLLAWVLFGIGVVVTLIVMAALYIALLGPPRARKALGGEKIVWIGGIAFPAVVLTGLLIWGLTLTANLTEDITGEEMRIRVTGELYWFRVDYLDAEGEVVMRDANEIHIPVDRPVVLELRSADVIHSLWVPNLAGKKDMIPGRINLLRIEADEAGEFGGVCAEYCGGAHALMGFIVVAHEEAEWDAWLAQRMATLDSAAPAGPGRLVFEEAGCGACHRVAGTEANGMTGPDLTFFHDRRSIGAGILPNNLGTTMGWIGDSQSIKPGNRMPSYDNLSAEELEAVALWLRAE